MERYSVDEIKAGKMNPGFMCIVTLLVFLFSHVKSLEDSNLHTFPSFRNLYHRHSAFYQANKHGTKSEDDDDDSVNKDKHTNVNFLSLQKLQYTLSQIGKNRHSLDRLIRLYKGRRTTLREKHQPLSSQKVTRFLSTLILQKYIHLLSLISIAKKEIIYRDNVLPRYRSSKMKGFKVSQVKQARKATKHLISDETLPSIQKPLLATNLEKQSNTNPRIPSTSPVSKSIPNKKRAVKGKSQSNIQLFETLKNRLDLNISKRYSTKIDSSMKSIRSSSDEDVPTKQNSEQVSLSQMNLDSEPDSTDNSLEKDDSEELEHDIIAELDRISMAEKFQKLVKTLSKQHLTVIKIWT